MINQELKSVAETAQLIAQGQTLLLAGDESVLAQLPKGNWIGGTIPYFMSAQGGQFTQDQIFVHIIPDYIADIVVTSYDLSTIPKIYEDAFEHGFTVLIVPAFSDVHTEFALNSTMYRKFACKPLIGWISGVKLADNSGVCAKTFAGPNCTASAQNAVAMHIKLPANKLADISIINTFSPGDGDVLMFETDGYHTKNILVNGQLQNIVSYLEQNNIDTRLPLVADYNGAHINISFNKIDKKNGTVSFYAPFFQGEAYKLAAPIADYVQEFCARIEANNTAVPIFACNCILNYVYSELEGKTTGPISGPITFGEIAYQLLNQTLVQLHIYDI